MGFGKVVSEFWEHGIEEDVGSPPCDTYIAISPTWPLSAYNGALTAYNIQSHGSLPFVWSLDTEKSKFERPGKD
jgi:hypothetical protein